MNYVQQEQPILLSGTNATPLPLGTGSVDITLVDNSHRWLLIDKLCIQVNSRLRGNGSSGYNQGELPAALYEAKVGTKLVSLTEDFVPLLAMSQMQSVAAQSEVFTDLESSGSSLLPLNFIEWIFPRPFLLRPGEALKVTIRQNSVDVGSVPMTTGMLPIDDDGTPATPVGALFTVTAKGSLVRIKAERPKTRMVPFIIAQAFDQRSVVGTGGANAREQTKMLENTTKRVLNMHALIGRWITWAEVAQGYPAVPFQQATNPAYSGILFPLVTIRDFAGYDICRDLPFDVMFPRQVGAMLQFEGAMQLRDVLKVTLTQDPRSNLALSGNANIFEDSMQGVVGLHAWREENL